MGIIPSPRSDNKHITHLESHRKAPRDTSAPNRDEAPDSRDIKDEVEKPKSKNK
ncbi:hypothetical protein [Emticicia sp. C21]|uniref:hypothetical protein n=1 Tax=Emticicia sp. C21 TaxID=2302915 RepID=UPI001313DAEA|nr:hypothetical protein [Emticicia sp. C21]